MADVTLAGSTSTKLAAHITDAASSGGRGDDILAFFSSAGVDSFIAVIVAPVGILLPVIIAISARSACTIVLVRTRETVTMAKVTNIGDPQVPSASSCKRICCIAGLAPRQPEIKISRAAVEDTLVVILTVRIIREGLGAKSIVLN